MLQRPPLLDLARATTAVLPLAVMMRPDALLRGPRSLPAGECAGWRLIASVVGFSALWGLAVGAVIYRLASWWEAR